MSSLKFCCFLLVSSAFFLLPSESATTAVPPTPCSCDGIAYDVSEEPFYVDDCIYCTKCGEITIKECPSLCVGAQHVEGQCCPHCPNGENCWAFDQVIPADEEVFVGDYRCRCQLPVISDEDRQANCEYYPLPGLY